MKPKRPFLTPVASVPGDAVARTIWNLDYLARTVFYNGYWRSFRPTRDAK